MASCSPVPLMFLLSPITQVQELLALLLLSLFLLLFSLPFNQSAAGSNPPYPAS